jgi:hypothetical protein
MQSHAMEMEAAQIEAAGGDSGESGPDGNDIGDNHSVGLAVKPAYSLLLAALAEVPGALLGIYLGINFRRKPAFFL